MRKTPWWDSLTRVGAPAILLALTGCASSEPGKVSVLLQPESVIIEGLEPGDGPGDVRDGWEISFERYVTIIGPVELRTGAEIAYRNKKSVAVDLTQVSPQGEPLFLIGEVDENRYDFFYHNPPEATQSDVPEEVLRSMEAVGANFSIAGTLRQTGGLSCPPRGLADPPADVTASGTGPQGDPCYPAEEVTFEILANASTHFGPCEVDGVPGVSVLAGATTTAAISIHGDHLFFNGFPEAGEGTAERFAQWLADCDLNLDGTVTTEELSRIEPADLAELDERFKLGGSPLVPLDSMLTYVRAQLKTQGHFQGEGECALDAFPASD